MALPWFGKLQCLYHLFSESLAQAASHSGHPEKWPKPHTGTGSCNSFTDNALLFATEWASKRERFFLHRYSKALVQHGDYVLIYPCQWFLSGNDDIRGPLALRFCIANCGSERGLSRQTIIYLTARCYGFFTSKKLFLTSAVSKWHRRTSLRIQTLPLCQLVNDVFEVLTRSGVAL